MAASLQIILLQQHQNILRPLQQKLQVLIVVFFAIDSTDLDYMFYTISTAIQYVY